MQPIVYCYQMMPVVMMPQDVGERKGTIGDLGRHPVGQINASSISNKQSEFNQRKDTAPQQEEQSLAHASQNIYPNTAQNIPQFHQVQFNQVNMGINNFGFGAIPMVGSMQFNPYQSQQHSIQYYPMMHAYPYSNHSQESQNHHHSNQNSIKAEIAQMASPQDNNLPPPHSHYTDSNPNDKHSSQQYLNPEKSGRYHQGQKKNIIQQQTKKSSKKFHMKESAFPEQKHEECNQNYQNENQNHRQLQSIVKQDNSENLCKLEENQQLTEEKMIAAADNANVQYKYHKKCHKEEEGEELIEKPQTDLDQYPNNKTKNRLRSAESEKIATKHLHVHRKSDYHLQKTASKYVETGNISTKKQNYRKMSLTQSNDFHNEEKHNGIINKKIRKRKQKSRPSALHKKVEEKCGAVDMASNQSEQRNCDQERREFSLKHPQIKNNNSERLYEEEEMNNDCNNKQYLNHQLPKQICNQVYQNVTGQKNEEIINSIKNEQEWEQPSNLGVKSEKQQTEIILQHSSCITKQPKVKDFQIIYKPTVVSRKIKDIKLSPEDESKTEKRISKNYHMQTHLNESQSDGEQSIKEINGRYKNGQVRSLINVISNQHQNITEQFAKVKVEGNDHKRLKNKKSSAINNNQQIYLSKQYNINTIIHGDSDIKSNPSKITLAFTPDQLNPQELTSYYYYQGEQKSSGKSCFSHNSFNNSTTQSHLHLPALPSQNSNSLDYTTYNNEGIYNNQNPSYVHNNAYMTGSNSEIFLNSTRHQRDFTNHLNNSSSSQTKCINSQKHEDNKGSMNSQSSSDQNSPQFTPINETEKTNQKSNLRNIQKKNSIQSNAVLVGCGINEQNKKQSLRNNSKDSSTSAQKLSVQKHTPLNDDNFDPMTELKFSFKEEERGEISSEQNNQTIQGESDSIEIDIENIESSIHSIEVEGDQQENNQDKNINQSILNKVAIGNASKNILKAFHKYTQQCQDSNGPAITSLNRMYQRNTMSNLFLIKIYLNQRYNKLMRDFIANFAQDWLIKSKVKDLDTHIQILNQLQQDSLQILRTKKKKYQRQKINQFNTSSALKKQSKVLKNNGKRKR